METLYDIIFNGIKNISIPLILVLVGIIAYLFRKIKFLRKEIKKEKEREYRVVTIKEDNTGKVKILERNIRNLEFHQKNKDSLISTLKLEAERSKNIQKLLRECQGRELKFMAENWLEKLANAKTQVVINEIFEYAKLIDNKELKSEIIQVSSRWNNLKSKINRGVINGEDANIETIQINSSIINIIRPLGPP